MNTKHLKAKILDLAIRGKLVEQKAEDGNAFDLLQKIREEKMPHGKMSHGLDFANAKSRKNKQQTETALAKVEDAFASDLQFEIPENWCWCRLGEIGNIITGNTPSKNESKFYNSKDVHFYKPSDLNQGINTIQSEDYVSLLGYEKSRKLPKNSILVTCIGATIGKTGLIREHGTCNQQINAILPSSIYIPELIYYWCISPYMQIKIKSESSSTTLPILNKDGFSKLLIPLPPLPEQKRIVSAIEKAFAQIDIIEKNKLNLKTYIKQTKSKVLDLAIRGKLVEQNTEDGNAFDLLQKIRDEKTSHRLDFANAKSRKNKQQTETALAVSNPRDISDNEIPFEIPENWCWCRLKDVCKEISDLDHRMPKPFPNGIPYISPLDFTKDGKINLKSAKKISLKDYEDLSKKSRPEKGDIIFPRYGTIGKIRCIDFEEPCLVSYSCATIKVNLNNMNNEYIKYVLASPLIQTHEIQKYINETTQANIGLQSIKDFKFPLPPLPEQKRIVAKIEQVFEQLDVLEKSMGE